MIKTCLGCGVKLQSTDADKLGYVPEKVIDKGYCRRCFKLIHYQDFTNAYQTINPHNILKKLANKQGSFIFILDFVNINHEAINYYHQIKMPKILVINKADIIPKNINYEQLKNWLKNEFKVNEDILFASSKKNIGLNKLNHLIEEMKEPIYFLGMTNVGKSSLLNELFALKNPLTTSMLPNTTLDFVKLNTNQIIYDTEGFPYHKTLPRTLIKKIMINEEIHPKNMPLKKDASILIEDIGRITTNINNSLTCFFSKNINIKKIYASNNLYLDEEPIIIKVPAKSNLIIKGVGFIYLKEPCSLTIYHLTKDLIEIVPAFWGV